MTWESFDKFNEIVSEYMPEYADCDYMVIRNNKTGKIVFTMAKGVML